MNYVCVYFMNTICLCLLKYLNVFATIQQHTICDCFVYVELHFIGHSNSLSLSVFHRLYGS